MNCRLVGILGAALLVLGAPAYAYPALLPEDAPVTTTGAAAPAAADADDGD